MTELTNRQAIGVLDGLWSNPLFSEHHRQAFEIGIKAIKALEQEPKIGHWIEHPEIETSTPEYLMFYECSECGDRQCFCKSDIHKKRFCSNCGAKMVEPQERSE